MKNRDNEFFREEELDELVEKRDYETLRDKMSRIFACPCCLNGFKHCRKYLEVFSKEEIRKTPTLAAAEAVIQAIYGNLEKAEKYASYVGDERLMKLHLDVIIPGTDRERATHAEIEVEFDRMLLAKRGHNPLTHRLAGHIPTDMTSAGTIAEFFPEVTAEEVQQALKSMKHYNNLLVAPGHLKRGFIYALLAMTGNYKEMHGLIVNYKPNPKCADSNIRLSQLYHDAISLAVRLICEYRENGAADSEYQHTFGVE